MASRTVTLEGHELMSSITLRVRMPLAFGLRMWAARKLLGLAGWVSGVGMVIEMDDEAGAHGA